MKQKRRWISLILAFCFILGLWIPGNAQAAGQSPEEILASMSTEEKIAQMMVVSPRYLKDEGTGKRTAITELPAEMEEYLKTNHFGGVILFSQNSVSTEQTVRLIDSIQAANAAGGAATQLLVAVDQEGGAITRLEECVQGPGNMALTATGDAENVSTMASIIGTEIAALGFNVDFCPVADVNSNPSNPIIGVRSFSDDTEVVSDYVKLTMASLEESGVIACPKHFPGHGDTETDSHSTLPLVDKSYKKIKELELLPFQAGIDHGAEMIMTAHIQYPKIEKGTYPSLQDPEVDISLPATLSKKIITDILRGDMGYNGVVITDAMDMDAIVQHFDPLDAATLAIEAGVDLILVPADISDSEGRDQLVAEIKALAEKADTDENFKANVDAAVLRILKLKEDHGLLEAYDDTKVEERVANAMSVVSTKANHDIEWEISKSAITLVKNANRTLPLIDEDEKTVILTAYDDEPLPMNVIVDQLRKTGRLPEGTTYEVHSYHGYEKPEDRGQVLEWIDGADNVIAVSEMGYIGYLTGNAAGLLDELLAKTHEQGGKFILMSVDLPYDVSRFQDADAIMITYGARSMNSDPRVDTEPMKRFGPNIAAGLYMMLQDEEAPTGKLPIEIPKLNKTGDGYKKAALYERGMGLTYKKDEPLPDFLSDNNLPVVEITIDEEAEGFGTIEEMLSSEDHSVKCTGSVRVRVPEGYGNEFTDAVIKSTDDLELEYIRGRGNVTWAGGSRKKPFKLKLKEKADLLGMGEDKTWALIANALDPSLLRNRIAYYMGDQLGLAFSPKQLPVEVMMNGEYLGSYTLSETVKIGKSRVAIDELKAKDTDEALITGGYLLRLTTDFDRPKLEENIFTTDRDVCFLFDNPEFESDDPDEKVGAPEQKAYISDYLQKTEDALYNGNVSEYMDLQSAADYWLMQCYTDNIDGFKSDSTCLFKPRDGKLTWGPLWDFDLSLGGSRKNVEGFNQNVAPWLDHLRENDPDFVSLLKERWAVLSEIITDVVKEDGVLDQYAEVIRNSWEDNLPFSEQSYDDFDIEIEDLRDWMIRRQEWFEENLDSIDRIHGKVTYVVDGQTVAENEVVIGKQLDRFPEIPEKDGYIFRGWMNDDVEFDPYQSEYFDAPVIWEDTTFTADFMDEKDAVQIEQIFLQSSDLWVDLRMFAQYPIPLSYVLVPEEAEVKPKWSSSDTDIAEVDARGRVIMKKTGEVIITATAPNDISASITFHIYDGGKTPAKELESLTLKEDIIRLRVGEYAQIQPVLLPQPSLAYVNYYTDDYDCINTYTNCGVVYGRSPGTATVIVSSGSMETICTVIVESSYSEEWVDGIWYNKNGTKTWKYKGSWKKVGKDWTFSDTSGWKAKNQWQKIDGKWYFFDKNGYMEKDAYRKGFYLNKNGVWDGKKSVTGWKQNSMGWWYAISDGDYLKDGWKKIDGKWYYFKARGYAAQNEFVNGWWLGKNCAMSDNTKYGWHKNSKGWWYGVAGGWYAKNGDYTIDGKKYTFDEKGYMK